MSSEMEMAGGGVEDAYGEDRATEEQLVTPWAFSVARSVLSRSPVRHDLATARSCAVVVRASWCPSMLVCCARPDPSPWMVDGSLPPSYVTKHSSPPGDPTLRNAPKAALCFFLFSKTNFPFSLITIITSLEFLDRRHDHCQHFIHHFVKTKTYFLDNNKFTFIYQFHTTKTKS